MYSDGGNFLRLLGRARTATLACMGLYVLFGLFDFFAPSGYLMYMLGKPVYASWDVTTWAASDRTLWLGLSMAILCMPVAALLRDIVRAYHKVNNNKPIYYTKPPISALAEQKEPL